ncbi:MAG: serine protease [Rhodospirillaceae bacterium]|nr:serine protease [Rhodospirillaceae bacterium]
MSNWDDVVTRIAPQVVKIETHDGWGTGFIVYGADNWVRTIATAYHVIENAYGKPFSIVSGDRKFSFGRPGRKDVLTARIGELDAVTLVLIRRGLPMPIVPLLERHETPLAVGMEIGWLGFPRIAEGLCFFSGRVSAIVDDIHFLVDGTAIHGVSGGPAFCITEHGPRIVGSITAYLPNRVP